jgi:hypothetical protein
MLCGLRAVQHVKILSSVEVFTAASDKAIFQADKKQKGGYAARGVIWTA